MRFGDVLVVVRGGGDLATGAAWRLKRARIPVVVCELAHPLAVRRCVAFSTAVDEDETVVEGVRAIRTTIDDARAFAATEVVPVVVTPTLPPLDADVVVDARMAKRPLDTTIGDAPLVVALGPGFTVGVHCHAVVETQRGAGLGRVLWSGSAAANTGTPGVIAGYGAERVLRAPATGTVHWRTRIGATVAAGAALGAVGGAQVVAPFAGVVRGLISEGATVERGQKIGDVDPRPGADWRSISDKALAVGGGVLEAVLTRLP